MRVRAERAAVWIAAAVCLLFAAGLSDVPRRGLVGGTKPPAPTGDAALTAVVSEDGKPAAGARVRVFAVGDAVQLAAEATTGADGRAVLAHLPRGETWVIADRSGSARASTRLVLEAGEREVKLPLHPAAELEVVVVDGAQRPIKNARVALYGADPLPFSAYTDATGLASLGGLGPGPWSVEASAGGFGRKLVREVGPDDSPLFLRLERDSQLEVHVIDRAGKSAAGATVLVAGSALWPAKSALSDADGRVQIAGLPRGFYDVRAERGSDVSEQGEGLMLEAGDHKSIEVRLVEGVFVRVLVTDGAGDPAVPIADADVALVEGGLSSFPRYGRTDASGRVKLGPIVGGDATVSAQASGFVPKSAQPVPQGESEARVALLRGATVSGRVVDDRGYAIEGVSLEVVGVGLDGMPIAESSALVGFRRDHFAFALPGPSPLLPAGELGVMPVVPDLPLGDAPLVSRALTARGGVDPWVSGRDGAYRLTPVTPGKVQVIARHPAYVETLSAPLSLDAGQRVTLEIVMKRGGTLEGRVLEADRRAVPGARVELSAADGSVERITYAADDGSFAFAAVPQDIVVSVARPEEPEVIVEKVGIEVSADQRRSLEIYLPEKKDPVALRVVDDRGFVVDRAEIHAASLDPGTALTRTLFSDEAGAAKLTGARGLPLRILVKRRGHAPRVEQIDEAPAELTLTLDREIVAEGEVRTRDGWTAGADVVLLTVAGDRHTKTDAGGRFSFAELGPGRARLIITADGYAYDERNVTIAADSRGRMDLGRIELARAGSIEGMVVDERGDPVAGARVAAGRVPTYLPIGPLPPGVAQTDGAGRFVLKDVEPGPTTVEAYKAGVGRDSSESVEVRARDAVRDVKIVLHFDADAVPSGAPASLAVTLSERAFDRLDATGRIEGRPGVLLAHVPYGGEAQRAGLMSGDQLFGVDGIPIRSLEHARAKLDGPTSHDLVLELYRPKLGRFKVRVRREKLRR
jgi:hypothetical protein